MLTPVQIAKGGRRTSAVRIATAFFLMRNHFIRDHYCDGQRGKNFNALASEGLAKLANIASQTSLFSSK